MGVDRKSKVTLVGLTSDKAWVAAGMAALLGVVTSYPSGEGLSLLETVLSLAGGGITGLLTHLKSLRRKPGH